MFKKLVKLDPNNGGDFSEVDPIRLRREALALKNHLDRDFNRKMDEYQVYNQVMPLVQGVLDGTLKLPINYIDYPLKYVVREGLVPEQFIKLFRNFRVAASSMQLEEPQIQIIDGERWAYMSFEEPGDYPDKLVYPYAD